MLYFISPFSFEKNLFEAYDQHMKLLSAEDWAVLSDLDVSFLTPDAPRIIKENIERHPKISLFTCITNRVANVNQLYQRDVSVDYNIEHHIQIAKGLAIGERNVVVETDDVISGMVMIIQKKTWDKIPPTTGILGVDHHISKSILDGGGKISIMRGIYVFHNYRIGQRISNTSHLV